MNFRRLSVKKFRLLAAIGLVGASYFYQSAPSLAHSEAQLSKVSATKSLGFEMPDYQLQPLPEVRNTAAAWQAVGMNAFLSQDYLNSLAAYNKAVDLSGSDNPEILEQRAWVRYRQERIGRAISDLEKAMQLYWDGQEYSEYRNARRFMLFIQGQQERLQRTGMYKPVS